MAQNLPAQSHELIPFDGETFIMMLGPTALFGLVSSTGFQRTVSCKKEKTAILAPILGATLILLFVPLPVLIGMYGKALWPDAASATIIFQVLFEAMPPLLAGLLIASICAAVDVYKRQPVLSSDKHPCMPLPVLQPHSFWLDF